METIEQVRARFAQEVQQQTRIRSAGLIAGLAAVPREQFLGPGPWKFARATEMSGGYQLTPDADPRHLYQNAVVAIDEHRSLNNGEPASLVLFMDALDLAPGDRLLHVGCGLGYYTAVTAHAVGPQGQVLGVEIDPMLAARAADNLRSHPSVRVLHADGTAEPLGSFDAIFVNAGCTRPLAVWLDQLAPGGRLVLPLTVSLPHLPAHGIGAMLRVARDGSGYRAQFNSSVAIYHCAGARSDDEEALLKTALAGGNRAAVVRLRRDTHAQETSCWLHASSFCLQLDPGLQRQKPAAVAVPAAVLAEYAGRYQLDSGTMLTATVTRGALTLEIPGRQPVVTGAGQIRAIGALRLYAATKRQFSFEELDAAIHFVTDVHGPVSSLLWEQDDQQLPAQRQP